MPTHGPRREERLPDPRNVLVEMTLVPRTGAVIRGTQAPAPAAVPAPGAARQIRILRTLEVDEYDPPLHAAAILPLAVPRPAPPDNKFRGTSRKAAKLSIADAPMETFNDVNDLIDSFEDHDAMVNMDIPTTAGSGRVDEEKRNVRVKAFLYAASHEDDNDFHLIIGRDPSKAAKYMTAEISGLPPRNSGAFEKLDTARSAYFEYFGDGLPGTSYDFYDPPIEIEIEGSLFWDASHAHGGRPGPQTLRPKMPVVWEIHPVTKIVFEP
ncbi:MAG TPA: hypothetical protein VGD96_19740 [Bradyrhizobium sp.]